MVTVELQSVIGNYTKCLHNLSILIILNGRPTSWGRHSQTQTKQKSVSASECVAGEVFHYSSDAYGSCMYGPVDKTAIYALFSFKIKTQKLNCLPNLLMINLVLSQETNAPPTVPYCLHTKLWDGGRRSVHPVT